MGRRNQKSLTAVCSNVLASSLILIDFCVRWLVEMTEEENVFAAAAAVALEWFHVDYCSQVYFS